MNRLLVAGLFLALIAPGIVHADASQAEIRFSPDSDQASWAGEEIHLNLELWSDAFSFSGQSFSLPEVQGGFLIQPDSTTIKLSERRGGVTWQGLRYTLLLFAQHGGRLQVPPFDVSFEVRAGYGQPATAFSFRTEPLSVEVKMPPGVPQDELLVTSPKFRLQWSWSPNPDSEQALALKVGDALSLQVERRADNVPGMVFAPLPVVAADGLAVYPDKPRVRDRVDRGEIEGIRTDSVTYLCEHEGRYELPAIRFHWWDPQRQVLAEKVIPALTINVVPNPALAAPATGSTTGDASTAGKRAWKALGGLLVAVLVLWIPGRRLVRWLAGAWRRWRATVEAGEAWAFRRVRQSCRAGDAASAYRAITTWLSRANGASQGMTLLELAAGRGDAALAREARSLQLSMLAQDSPAWDGRALLESLARLRGESLHDSRRQGNLHPLNPV